MEDLSELLLSSVTCVTFVVYLIGIDGAAVKSQESECTMVGLDLSRCTIEQNTS